MWLVFLFPLFFWAMIRSLKGKGYIINKIVLYLYLGSSVTACYLSFFSKEYSKYSMDPVAVIYLIAMLFVLLYPMRAIDMKAERTIERSDDFVIFPFSLFVIAIFILYFGNQIVNVSISDILQDAADVRYSNAGKGNFSITSGTFFAYVEIIAVNATAVPIGLAFYYMCVAPRNKILIYLLLFSSMVNPLLSLRSASRVYFPCYVLTLILLFILLRKNVSSTWNRSLKNFIVVIGSLVTILFIVISASRFADGHYNDEGGTFTSMLAYYGQNFCNFSPHFSAFPDGLFPNNHGGLNFPFFAKHTEEIFNLNAQLATDIKLNVFSTTIGSWIGDWGHIWTVVVALIYGGLIYFVANRKRYTVFTLIYIIMILQFAYYSLFYFVSTVSKYYIYMLVVLMILDQISYKKSSTIQKLKGF